MLLLHSRLKINPSWLGEAAKCIIGGSSCCSCWYRDKWLEMDIDVSCFYIRVIADEVQVGEAGAGVSERGWKVLQHHKGKTVTAVHPSFCPEGLGPPQESPNLPPHSQLPAPSGESQSFPRPTDSYRLSYMSYIYVSWMDTSPQGDKMLEQIGSSEGGGADALLWAPSRCLSSSPL